jgi:site-specific recombinase XerD
MSLKRFRKFWDSCNDDSIERMPYMPDNIFWKKCKSCYYGYYYPKDAKSSKDKKQFSLGIHNKQHRSAAKEKYSQRLIEIWEAERKRNEKRYKLSELQHLYVEDRRDVGIQQEQIDEINSSFRLFARKIGDLYLDEITSEMADSFIKKGWNTEKWGKKQTVSIFTKRKHLSNLKAAFNHAKKWKKENPFSEINLPRRGELPIPEFLTEAEFKFLLCKIDLATVPGQRLYRFCIIAFWSNLRLGEILQLEIKDIDHRQQAIKIRRKSHFMPKWKIERDVPTRAEVQKILSEQLILKQSSFNSNVKNSSFYFCNEEGKKWALNTVSSDFKELVVRVFPDRPGLHFHSLRHSYGVYNCEKGVPLELIKQWMGHKSLRTTEIYARMRPTIANQQFHLYHNKSKEQHSESELSTLLSLLPTSSMEGVNKAIQQLLLSQRQAA